MQKNLRRLSSKRKLHWRDNLQEKHKFFTCQCLQTEAFRRRVILNTWQAALFFCETKSVEKQVFWCSLKGYIQLLAEPEKQKAYESSPFVSEMSHGFYSLVADAWWHDHTDLIAFLCSLTFLSGCTWEPCSCDPRSRRCPRTSSGKIRGWSSRPPRTLSQRPTTSTRKEHFVNNDGDMQRNNLTVLILCTAGQSNHRSDRGICAVLQGTCAVPGHGRTTAVEAACNGVSPRPAVRTRARRIRPQMTNHFLAQFERKPWCSQATSRFNGVLRIGLLSSKDKSLVAAFCQYTPCVQDHTFGAPACIN